MVASEEGRSTRRRIKGRENPRYQQEVYKEEKGRDHEHIKNCFSRLHLISFIFA
jgi:hypothetical protein